MSEYIQIQQTVPFTKEAFDERGEHILADLFRLWDCYAQSWVVRAPVLFRFESSDLMVSAPCAQERCCSFDPVDDQTGVNIVADEPDACLCWRRDPAYAQWAGEVISFPEVLGILNAVQASSD